MKTIISKVVLLTILAIGILSGCVSYTDYDLPILDCTQPNLIANQSVPQVIAVSSSLVTPYTYDDILEGYVVSSDAGGNFYKSISFQTLATATVPALGFSVPVDASNTYIDYPPGVKVFVKLKDLHTDIKDGGLRIGSIYVSSFGQASVGRIPQTQYKDKLIASCTLVSEEVLVKKLPSITQLLDDANLNTLVEISDVQFTAEAIGRHYYESANDIGGATNHYLTDRFGIQVIFRTSSYAAFAGSLVPNNSGTIRGVLTKYGTDYQFMARTESDIKLSNDPLPSIFPFYMEDFQTSKNNQTLNTSGWVNFVAKGTLAWKEKTSTVAGKMNGYAEFTATNTANSNPNVLNEAWLISPLLNFNTSATKLVTFKAAQHHLDVDSPDNSLQVFVSTDFNGTDVKTATWTPVRANIPIRKTPWNEFLSSSLDLSAYQGSTIYVAFKFTGSGTDTTLDGSFQIDDFKAFRY
jgi:hypothetical protein